MTSFVTFVEKKSGTHAVSRLLQLSDFDDELTLLCFETVNNNMEENLLSRIVLHVRENTKWNKANLSNVISHISRDIYLNSYLKYMFREKSKITTVS